MRRLLTVLLVAGAALVVAVVPAQAHNVLTGSDPSNGAQLASMPGRVTLTFDQPVRADFAQVALTGPDGAVTKAAVQVANNVVTATLPASAGIGAYAVGYQIVSNDGHPVSGKIDFAVTGEGVPAGGNSAAAVPSAAAGVPAMPVRSGGGTWVWWLLVIAMLLSGLGIRVVARHGRPAKGQSA